jgi:hypothetical protein
MEPSLATCRCLVLRQLRYCRGLTYVNVEIGVVDVKSIGGLLEVLRECQIVVLIVPDNNSENIQREQYR